MDNITLILEGGALRSMYTAGVLDTFMRNNIEAQTIIGVSAGALSGLNYLSKQIGRTAKINIDYCNDPNYIGTKALLKEKGLIGFNYLFEEISKNDTPFDFETFKNSKQEFITVVANCETAETEYISKSNAKDIFKVVQASSSLPLCSKMVEIDGKHYIDGGITDSIPIEWAIEQGFKNIVVVLTRDRDYRKPGISKMMKNVYKRVYRQFPKTVDKLCTLPERYNQTKELLNKLEDEGKILVIRPQKEVTVSRLEKDKKKLESLYQDGMNDAEEKIDDIIRMIQRKGDDITNLPFDEESLYEAVMAGEYDLTDDNDDSNNGEIEEEINDENIEMVIDEEEKLSEEVLEREDKEENKDKLEPVKDGYEILQESVNKINNQKKRIKIKGIKNKK